MSEEENLRSLVGKVLSSALAEARSLLERDGTHVDTDLVRRQLGRVDGVRYATNLLADEQLLDASTAEELRRVLLVLRIAGQTAAFVSRDGFFQGLSDVRLIVARLLEGLSLQSSES
jgi:hypothetical protein